MSIKLLNGNLVSVGNSSLKAPSPRLQLIYVLAYSQFKINDANRKDTDLNKKQEDKYFSIIGEPKI